MPFDPTLPIDNSPMAAPEMRAQLNSLKDLCDAQQVFINEILGRLDDVDVIFAGIQAQLPSFVTQPEVEEFTANTANAVDASPTVISNPPTAAEVTSLRDKLNELIAALQR